MALTTRSKEFAENYCKIIRSQLPPFRHSMDFHGDQQIHDAIRNYKSNRGKIEEEFFLRYWQKNRAGREEAIKYLENVNEKFCSDYKRIIQEKFFEHPDMEREELEQFQRDEKRKILQEFETGQKIGSDDFNRGKKMELDAKLDAIGNGMTRRHRESRESSHGSFNVEGTLEHEDTNENQPRSRTSSTNVSINFSAAREEIAGPSGIQQYRRSSTSDAGPSYAKKPRISRPVTITIEEEEEEDVSEDEDGENYHELQDHVARRRNATHWENDSEAQASMTDMINSAEEEEESEEEVEDRNDPDYEANTEEEEDYEENVARSDRRGREGYFRQPMFIPCHIDIIIQDGEKTYYQCKLCPRGRPGKSDTHIRKHRTCPFIAEVFEGNQFISYACTLCEEYRELKNELRQHIGSAHGDVINGDVA